MTIKRFSDASEVGILVVNELRSLLFLIMMLRLSFRYNLKKLSLYVWLMYRLGMVYLWASF